MITYVLHSFVLSDFIQLLFTVQAEVKRVAEREAKEKEEEERRKKEKEILRASLKLSPCVKVTKNRPLNVYASVNGSPGRSSSSSTGNKSNSIDKEKSKRALKKAQMLRRNKLKDAKAKLLDASRIESSSDTSLSESETEKLKMHLSARSNVLAELRKSTTSNNTTITSTVTTKSADATNERTNVPNNILDLSNAHDLKSLIKQQEQQQQSTDVTNKPVTLKNQPVASSTTTAKRKQHGHDTRPLSKIVHGAATFGTNSNGGCPCNVKAMYLCKQCGSAWHGDCIDSDKICILCS